MEYLIPIFTGDPPDLTTGLTGANIKFYYNSDNTEKTGLTITEVANGIYRCNGFSDDTAQYIYMKINGVTNASFATQWLGGIPVLQYMTGLGSNIVTLLNARTENAQTETITAVWTFGNGSVASHPKVALIEAGYPALTDGAQYTYKKYVDDLFASSQAMAQNEYRVICDVDSTDGTRYSKSTVELCAAYLFGLGNLSTYRGLIDVHPTNATSNSINLDDGTSQWAIAGGDMFSANRVRLVRRAPNPSLTVDIKMDNFYISDSIDAARSYTNFTFKDCLFLYSGTSTLTFTSCTFRGHNTIRMTGGGTLAMANCKGSSVHTNADFTPTGTQVVDLRTGLDLDDLES